MVFDQGAFLPQTDFLTYAKHFNNKNNVRNSVCSTHAPLIKC